MHDLAEIIEKSKEIKELKEQLMDCLKSEMTSKGVGCVDTEEAGEVVDMIKDLSETEKYCMEALYFQKVVEAMTSYEEPRYGYMPIWYNNPMDEMPYGYTGTRNPNSGNWGNDQASNNRQGYFMPDGNMSEETPYGRAYNEYKRRRKYYTTTNSPEDKREMEMSAEEHVNATITTIRDIWKDADTALKKRMKDNFTKLVNDMTV